MTLIAVVILFMVCQTPAAVTLIYSSFFAKESKIQLILGNIFNFLVAVNSATNFLLYCVLSDKYRRTFVLTFFPRYELTHEIGQAHAFKSSDKIQ